MYDVLIIFHWSERKTEQATENYKWKNNKTINFQNDSKRRNVDCAFCYFDALIFYVFLLRRLRRNCFHMNVSFSCSFVPWDMFNNHKISCPLFFLPNHITSLYFIFTLIVLMKFIIILPTVDNFMLCNVVISCEGLSYYSWTCRKRFFN